MWKGREVNREDEGICSRQKERAKDRKDRQAAVNLSLSFRTAAILLLISVEPKIPSEIISRIMKAL